MATEPIVVHDQATADELNRHGEFCGCDGTVVIAVYEPPSDLEGHCRTCGALPGEECQSQSRHHGYAHAARRHAASS